jgi:hypothetical protein
MSSDNVGESWRIALIRLAPARAKPQNGPTRVWLVIPGDRFLLARGNLAVELIDRQDRHRCHSAHHQPEYHPDHRDPPDSMFAIIASKDGDFALGDEVLGNSVSLLPIRHGQRPRKLGRYTRNYGHVSPPSRRYHRSPCSPPVHPGSPIWQVSRDVGVARLMVFFRPV